MIFEAPRLDDLEGDIEVRPHRPQQQRAVGSRQLRDRQRLDALEGPGVVVALGGALLALAGIDLEGPRHIRTDDSELLPLAASASRSAMVPPCSVRAR